MLKGMHNPIKGMRQMYETHTKTQPAHQRYSRRKTMRKNFDEQEMQVTEGLTKGLKVGFGSLADSEKRGASSFPDRKLSQGISTEGNSGYTNLV